MNKDCLRNYFIVSVTLLMLFCAPGIEVSQIKTMPTAASPFYRNVIGSINYYAMSFDGGEPLNKLNPSDFGMGKDRYFEFLDNGWFLNWKSYREALTECRRGVWAIEDSTLIFLYLQRSKLESINNDTVEFVPKKYVEKWPLYKVTKDSLILKQKRGLVISFPKAVYETPEISNPCKYNFTE